MPAINQFPQFKSVDGSSNVNFLQAGTGAQVRSVQSKLRDVVSVKDFGAAGDGVADDTAAFNAAAQLAQLTVINKPSTKYTFSSNSFQPTPIGAAWFPDPSLSWQNLTDNGKLNLQRGTRPDFPDGVNIWRFTDRVFVGEAASKLTGSDSSADNNPERSWFGNVNNYAGYLGRNGKLVISSSPDYPSLTGGDLPYAISVGVRGSDTLQECIGVGATVVPSDTVGSPNGYGWAFIAELQNEGTGQCIGLEVAAKNKAPLNSVLNPNAQTTGVFGLWLAGGGDATFGGSPTHPSTAGIVLLKNASTWNSGIVIMRDSLTDGKAINLSSDAIGGNHAITWYNQSGNETFSIVGNTTVAPFYQLLTDNNGVQITIANQSAFRVAGLSTMVNGLGVFGSATGIAPQIYAMGSDANIDIQLFPKGTGLVRYGTYASTGDVACNGYIEIKDAAGNVRKLMTTA